MRKHKWAIIVGSIVAAAVLLVGLGFGVSVLFAQGTETIPAQDPVCPPGCRPEGPMVGAARFGWQARGQIERVAEALGMSVEDLMVELRQGKSVAEVAEEQGVALETVVEALLAPRREALTEAVAEGRLTQEEADEMLVEVQERVTEQLQQSDLPWGPADRMRQAQRLGWQIRGQADLVAETLGMSTEDLVAELREGKSVAEVAEERDVALETVVEALLGARTEALAEAVAEGQLTQEEADEMLIEAQERLPEQLQQSGLPMADRLQSPLGAAGRYGWQARGHADLLAETLGISTEDLMVELRQGKSVAEVAEERDVALETVVEALLGARTEALAEAVAEGRLTQEEADEILAEAQEHLVGRLQEPASLEKMGPAGWIGQAERFGWQIRGQVELAAETLGMSAEDLVAELREGKSVAEVAKEQGVALEAVVEALLAPRREALTEAVAEGRLTQEEADEMLIEAQERIIEYLEQSGPLGDRVPRGRWGRDGAFGLGRPGRMGFNNSWGGGSQP